MRTSRIEKFFKKSPDERMKIVREFANLSEEEASVFKSGIKVEDADRMIENVIGKMETPLGIATNFLINKKDYLIPMAIEEPSVVAAASNAARIARGGGGFFTTSTEPVMIGQIQVVGAGKDAKRRIQKSKKKILEIANAQDVVLVGLGGGARDLEVRALRTRRGTMLVLHLLVDCRDAMGANTVNTMCEKLAPVLEEMTGGEVILRIISNLADRRLASARAVFPKKELGEETVRRIVLAHSLAEADAYRAATHNKGIMNGVIAVALATGNDTRALEAGAHTYASRSGRYRPLTTWRKDSSGDLVGTIEMPMAVGVVGGITRSHPIARTSLKILGVKSAKELAEVMAAVGLAQNLAALRALATEGIQRGHMKLHARNVAAHAGAKGELIDRIADIMVNEGKINAARAKELMEKTN